MIKNLPASRRQVQLQGCRDSLEGDMATFSSVLAWRILILKSAFKIFQWFCEVSVKIYFISSQHRKGVIKHLE